MQNLKIYLSAPFALAALFTLPQYSVFIVAAYGAFLAHWLGGYRFAWKFFRPAPAPANATENRAEATLTTRLFRAPHELLGVAEDAGTTMIFQSFHRLAMAEQQDNLKFTQQGRRLQAAKKNLLARRRRVAKGA